MSFVARQLIYLIFTTNLYKYHVKALPEFFKTYVLPTAQVLNYNT